MTWRQVYPTSILTEVSKEVRVVPGFSRHVVHCKWQRFTSKMHSVLIEPCTQQSDVRRGDRGNQPPLEAPKRPSDGHPPPVTSFESKATLHRNRGNPRKINLSDSGHPSKPKLSGKLAHTFARSIFCLRAPPRAITSLRTTTHMLTHKHRYSKQ